MKLGHSATVPVVEGCPKKIKQEANNNPANKLTIKLYILGVDCLHLGPLLKGVA